MSVVRREKIQTRRWRDVDATKTTTHLRGDGRKVPGIRGVLRQNGLGAIIARRGDERVYERHDTLRRAQKKNEDQEKGTPLFFPTKAERNSIQIERIIRWESETNLKSTTLHESNKKKKNGGGGGRGGYAHGQTQKKKTQLVVVALLLSIDSTSGVPIEIDVPFARRGPRPVLTHAGGREVHLIPFIAIEIIAQSAVERVFYVLFVLTVKIVTVARFAVGGGSSWVELDVEDRVS